VSERDFDCNSKLFQRNNNLALLFIYRLDTFFCKLSFPIYIDRGESCQAHTCKQHRFKTFSMMLSFIFLFGFLFSCCFAIINPKDHVHNHDSTTSATTTTTTTTTSPPPETIEKPHFSHTCIHDEIIKSWPTPVKVDLYPEEHRQHQEKRVTSTTMFAPIRIDLNTDLLVTQQSPIVNHLYSHNTHHPDYI
jgi:hypothetical protein